MISRAFKNKRLLKALTGLSEEAFNQLLPQFEVLLHARQNHKPRQRAAGAGRKNTLSDSTSQLFFILFYLKVYPTFDLAGFLFGVDRSRPCRWVQTLLPVLEEALGRSCVLPKRKIQSVDEFLQHFPEVKDLLIDGTERRTQKPQSPKNGKRRYSGKKRSHTRKNVLCVSEDRQIMLLSATKNGRRHDKWRLDQTGWLHHFPSDLTLWVDTGFVGIEESLPTSVTVMRPTKRSKNSPLTHSQKQMNQAISSVRIRVEHAIAGIKRFNVLAHIYRNRRGQDDQFMLLASALWNLQLSCH